MSVNNNISIKTVLVIATAILLGITAVFFPSLAVVLGLLFPLIILLIRSVDKSAFEDKVADAGIAILFLTAFCSLIIFSKSNKIKCDICPKFISGKVIRKMVTVEPDEGQEYEEMKTVFLADTEAGENFVWLTGVLITVIAIGSPIIIYRSLNTATPNPRKTSFN